MDKREKRSIIKGTLLAEQSALIRFGSANGGKVCTKRYHQI